MKKTINIDKETTGLWVRDEVLEVAIINSQNEVLFNERIKPTRRKKWNEAARVNGIYPEHLRACKTIKHYKAKIAEILQNADEIVGYNTCFDLEMLENSGLSLNLKQNVEIIDVMEMFAEYWGEWSDNFYSYKWQKLSKAAGWFGYKFKAHNALEDVKATKYIYEKLTEGCWREIEGYNTGG